MLCEYSKNYKIQLHSFKKKPNIYKFCNDLWSEITLMLLTSSSFKALVDYVHLEPKTTTTLSGMRKHNTGEKNTHKN